MRSRRRVDGIARHRLRALARQLHRQHVGELALGADVHALVLVDRDPLALLLLAAARTSRSARASGKRVDGRAVVVAQHVVPPVREERPVGREAPDAVGDRRSRFGSVADSSRGAAYTVPPKMFLDTTNSCPVRGCASRVSASCARSG